MEKKYDKNFKKTKDRKENNAFCMVTKLFKKSMQAERCECKILSSKEHGTVSISIPGKKIIISVLLEDLL